jgi:uncharacterized membrane protein YsdA (DUF1294 family)
MGFVRLIFFIVIFLNILAFILIGLDKYKSKKNYQRIREKTFFLIAALGGSMGVLTGMYCFRHKTKHTSFTLGVPAILALQLALLYYLVSSYPHIFF